ncbi:glycosyl hydrolase family 18 protein [Metabacillus sediminilitoris]|uniref:LysM peptidoglycan-binding domain-containing protein n=1 Tax=Metabacillus sediminilitoris TaxID=2567941 RepID=A0A4S4C443_9BACI|nr:glycosyl hydrolase family 18 protein [Metabacillus sediminilitoris]QGQ45151.1 LysM peptidoglycan-binding domain-containing protein [Metabacillus sediminilitoris]THF82550.1 LysM peptidoglycan-binding domain-containing protein [Metabacillus sediminilitoris]
MKNKIIIVLVLITYLFNVPIFAQAQVIHEVRSGDSLDKMSKQYNVNPIEIAKLNGLAKNAQLVFGQALLLQGSNYYVQPGESLWEIAYRHSVSEEQLILHNQLKSKVLVPGQLLKIPHSKQKNIWTGTYFVPKDKNANAWLINNYSSTLSSLFIFEYRSDYAGNIIEVAENEAHKLAWKQELAPYATLSNLSEKGFDPDLTHHLISNPWKRKNFINNIYSLLHTHDYKGVVIDFEQVRLKDRSNLNQFIKELSAKLHHVGMEVLMAVPPKQGDKIPSHSTAYDYKTLGKYLDKMFLMTYDWHWPGGPSGPIAPINKVEETINYAITAVPRSKLMLGIPQYAYDWTISGENKTGKAYSTQHAIDLYVGYESQIHYDQNAAAPWFRYVDKQGTLHEVWFEDPRSLLKKFRLIKEYNLAGMGCWHLGLTMPQTEELVLEEFKVK